MKAYTFKETKNKVKKINGHYDAQTHIITTEEGEYDVLTALSDFDDADISFSIGEKTEEELDED